jgi:methylmalonyl-CoA/ethylmalonyl-CoA epimerase
MIRNVDHIGIAVRSLEERLSFWADALGLEVEGIETVEGEKVKVAFLPAGRCRVELLEATAEDSPIARHIAKRGEGIHHMTLEVDDIDAMLTKLRSDNVEILGDGVREGAGGHRVAFLHPRAAGGVLVELVEIHNPEQPAPAPKTVEVGAEVLVYLRDPQEKLWGLLRQMDGTGISVEGVDLHSFEDWLASLDRDSEESFGGPSVTFVPMARVEKILLDQPAGALPSLAQRVARKAGCTVAELFDRD